MAPLFAVVIPTYNQADYLKEAIDSVLAQSFTDFEIVVVNNHSTDNTREVIDSFNDPRITSIDFSNDGVIGAGRNVGIRAAKSDYVCFLDSDDTWYPEKLASTVADLRFIILPISVICVPICSKTFCIVS